MAVHVEKRRGVRRLVIDIRYWKSDGTRGRFRHDAEVQTVAAAHAEDRRRLASLALTGSPEPGPESIGVSREPLVPPHQPTPLPKTVPQKDCITFQEVSDRYLRTFAPSHLKPSTLFGYRRVLNNVLVPQLGEKRVDEIDSNLAREVDAGLVQRGVRPSTRRNVQAVLRSVLCRYSVEARFLDTAPVLPRLPKVGRKIVSTLTREEVDRILEASGPEHRVAFMLAAYAGLRAGEIRGLRWRDVDLKAKQLVVRRTICRGEIATPKSGHERIVPLVDELATALTSGGTRPPGSAVSTDADGEPWSEYAVGNAFRRACKRAGLTSWRLHDLRHYFVTELFRRGAPAPAVQALAGHAELETTQKYAHVVAVDLRRAISVLNPPVGQQDGQQVGNSR